MTAWIRVTSRLGVGLALAVAMAGSAYAQGRGGRGQQPEPEPLKWRFMGPSIGNRIAAVAGVPGDPTIYYAGAASGGVWKSTDSGATFAPVFDGQPVQAIGALARRAVGSATSYGPAPAKRGRSAPSDVMGDGVYKSTDAGATWTNMGLAETGRIGRIIVHPTNPNIVYVCALGRATGPQQERGVFKTTDGGETWKRVAVRRREHRLLRPVDGCARIRTCCSPARGRSRCTRGRCTAAVRAAAST